MSDFGGCCWFGGLCVTLFNSLSHTHTHVSSFCYSCVFEQCCQAWLGAGTLALGILVAPEALDFRGPGLLGQCSIPDVTLDFLGPNKCWWRVVVVGFDTQESNRSQGHHGQEKTKGYFGIRLDWIVTGVGLGSVLAKPKTKLNQQYHLSSSNQELDKNNKIEKGDCYLPTLTVC